jgi:hypothetical protein
VKTSCAPPGSLAGSQPCSPGTRSRTCSRSPRSSVRLAACSVALEVAAAAAGIAVVVGTAAVVEGVVAAPTRSARLHAQCKTSHPYRPSHDRILVLVQPATQDQLARSIHLWAQATCMAVGTAAVPVLVASTVAVVVVVERVSAANTVVVVVAGTAAVGIAVAGTAVVETAILPEMQAPSLIVASGMETLVRPPPAMLVPIPHVQRTDSTPRTHLDYLESACDARASPPLQLLHACPSQSQSSHTPASVTVATPCHLQACVAHWQIELASASAVVMARYTPAAIAPGSAGSDAAAPTLERALGLERSGAMWLGSLGLWRQQWRCRW